MDKKLKSIFDNHTLGPTTKLVYIYLVQMANKDGECWPNYEHIMAACGITSKATVSKSLKELTSAGEIVVFRKSNGFRHSNRYGILPCR